MKIKTNKDFFILKSERIDLKLDVLIIIFRTEVTREWKIFLSKCYVGKRMQYFTQKLHLYTETMLVITKTHWQT